MTRRPGADARPAPESRHISLDGISVVPGMRRLQADVVSKLAESMKVLGQISPIGVRRRGGPEGMGFLLIYGRHRYEAARKLGWDSIRCEIWDGLDATRAELWAIDDNLTYDSLTPAEQALHYGRRQALFEKQAKQGAAPGRGKPKRRS
jgi:ParB-like chromosome segregation protein Spo0J